MIRKLLIAAVVAGIAAAPPLGGSVAYAQPGHGEAARHDDGGRPVIRFNEGGAGRAHVASVPRFTRFVRPHWAPRRPWGWRAGAPHRHGERLPFYVLGWFLSALSR